MKKIWFIIFFFKRINYFCPGQEQNDLIVVYLLQRMYKLASNLESKHELPNLNCFELKKEYCSIFMSYICRHGDN